MPNFNNAPMQGGTDAPFPQHSVWVDFDRINRAAMSRMPDLLGRLLPGGHTEGDEYVCRNPNRADNGEGSFKINTRTGKWADFSPAAGASASGGDIISLVAYLSRVNQARGARQLDEMLGGAPRSTWALPPATKQTEQPKPVPIVPVPADAPSENFRHPRHGYPTQKYEYRTASGELAGYALRFDFQSGDGKPDKDILPVTFCELGDGRRGWRSKGIPAPRPPYNLPEVIARPDAAILVCEGEKAVDAARQLFADYCATTPMHGAKSPRLTDWTHVCGRNVIICPDHDEAGATFANAVAGLALEAGAASVSVVAVPSEFPHKWDLADPLPEGVTVDGLRRLLDEAEPWSLAEVDSTDAQQQGATADTSSKPKRKPKNAPILVRQNFPTIQMFAGMLDQWIDEAEHYLVEYDGGVFSFGDLVCRIAPAAITTAHRSILALRVVEIQTQHLIERFSKVCQFTTYEGRRDAWVAVVCPPSIAKGYLERIGLWKLRPLLGIISCPTLRRDGSVLDQEGYDSQTRLFADWRGTVFPQIAANPTKADAVASLNFIADLYSEIPFRDSASLSVALSMGLSAVARHALRRVPMVGVNATSPGSGKSMLADIAAMIATGSEAPAISVGSDPEELKKTLGAELSQGASIVSLDNCEGPVGGELINSVLTQDKVKVRILGKSKMVDIPRGALLFCNGNGLTIAGDLVRRTILATIDPKMEKPWTRTFSKKHPVERIRDDRGAYVVAAITVLRAYQLADVRTVPPLHLAVSRNGRT